MAKKKKIVKPCGFNVETPKVGLFPAGSIVGVRGNKVILAEDKKKTKK